MPCCLGVEIDTDLTITTFLPGTDMVLELETTACAAPFCTKLTLTITKTIFTINFSAHELEYKRYFKKKKKEGKKRTLTG